MTGPSLTQNLCLLHFVIAFILYHYDIIKWKHFSRYWPFVRGIHRSPVNSPHKGQWHGALMFSLICARINGWVNNREAGDLGRHHAHYDVIVRISAKHPKDFTYTFLNHNQKRCNSVLILMFVIDYQIGCCIGIKETNQHLFSNGLMSDHMGSQSHCILKKILVKMMKYKTLKSSIYFITL